MTQEIPFAGGLGAIERGRVMGDLMTMMKRQLQAYLSRQLKHPSGWVGGLLLQWLNQENSSMNQLVFQNLELKHGQRILEIGFGGGDLIHRLLQANLSLELCGIDPSITAIAMAQKRFKSAIAAQTFSLHQASAENLPCPANSFDAIATINTLYFWRDVSRVLQECHRVLKPGGIIAIAYNSKDFLETQQATLFGFNAHEVDEVERYLQIARYSRIKTISGKCLSNGRFFCTCGYLPNT